jgi:hypothetical protein
VDQWLHKNKALILELQRLCGEHGCSGDTAGHVVAYLWSNLKLRRDAARVGLTDLVDAAVKARLQKELPAPVAEWALTNLWARPPPHSPTAPRSQARPPATSSPA